MVSTGQFRPRPNNLRHILQPHPHLLLVHLAPCLTVYSLFKTIRHYEHVGGRAAVSLRSGGDPAPSCIRFKKKKLNFKWDFVLKFCAPTVIKAYWHDPIDLKLGMIKSIQGCSICTTLSGCHGRIYCRWAARGGKIADQPLFLIGTQQC